VLGWLAEESRASRLSWGEVVKRLSEQPADASTFISKKVRSSGEGWWCCVEGVGGGGALHCMEAWGCGLLFCVLCVQQRCPLP
jgi:hypothetical protein